MTNTTAAPKFTPGPLTPAEDKERMRLQRKWATQRATMREIQRCRDLEHRAAAYSAEQAADRAYSVAYSCARAALAKVQKS